MEFFLQLPAIVGLLITLAFICDICLRRLLFSKSKDAPPEPVGAWPVIGHLHLLRGRGPLPEVLGAMADEHGPVFMLRFGMCRTLVISSPEAAKECFTINDKAVSARPRDAIARLLGLNCSMFGFAPYGPYWRSMRKLATLELLSNARIELLKDVRSMEIHTCMKELYNLWVNNDRSPVKIEMKKWLGNLNYNLILKMIAGKRYFGSGGDSEEAWKFRKAAGEFFRLMTVMVPSDMFPFLGWLDIGGHERAMKAAAREMDSVMAELLEEHRKKRASGTTDGDQDFMDVMISVVEDAEFAGLDKDMVIRSTSLTLILGGTDSGTGSLTMALALLLNHPDALSRVRAELDTHVGRDRLVAESDIKNLIYLQSVVKESFRLHPFSPLLNPREAIEEFSVSGYRIPVGTRVMVNAWKIHRDQGTWENPAEFQPERFMTSHAGVDVRGQHHELIPFGAGRRSCAAIGLAMEVLHLALARLIQGFDLRTPGDEPVEMSEAMSKLGAGSIPLEVVITPRLAAKLYE